MIYIAGQNILANLCLTCYSTFQSLRAHWNERGFRKRALAALERQIENRKDLSNYFASSFKGFKKTNEVIRAIKFCREWKPKQDWLLANKIKIESFPQEI